MITEFVHFLRYIEDVSQTTPGLLHDIANPLTTATAALETVLRDAEPGRQYQPTAIHELSLSLECLQHIQVILRQNRPTFHLAQPKKNHTVTFSLRQEVGTVLHLYKAKLQEKRTQIQMELPPLVRLQGNPAQFRQLVGNLLSNATDVSDSVHIYADQDSSFLTVTIKDHGPGISSRVLPHIFQPFFTTKATGTGLGLSIVKNIIEHEFDGQIEVSSQLNQGATFTLKFPTAKVMI